MSDDAKARARGVKRRANELWNEGKGLDALVLLEQAFELDPDDAQSLSRLALLYALERGQIRRGLELSQEALDKDKSDPEIYLNLARIYLKNGQKAEAIHVLRAGLERAPEHAGLSTTLGSLGVRKRPVVDALPREHPLNRMLGRVATWLGLR